MQKTKQKSNSTKGCLKISSFFKVEPKTSQIQILDKQFPLKINNDTKLGDEGSTLADKENDNIQTSPVIKRKTNKRAVKDVLPCNNGTLAVPKRRKVDSLESSSLLEPDTACNGNSNLVILDESESDRDCTLLPSTSEYKQGNQNPQVIFVKTPDKLLTPAALKAYTTPEKQKFLQRIKTPTPKKLNFSDLFPSGTDTLLSNIDELSKNHVDSVKLKHTTPPKKARNSPQLKVTPAKRTPRKLFDRSPENLCEFNVQVLRDFVKITPSKSNEACDKEDDVIFICSTEKKQSSILKYMSSSPSNKCSEVQHQNERTPVKKAVIETDIPSISKVRTKLDFSNCENRAQMKSPVKDRNGETSAIQDIFGELSFGEWEDDIGVKQYTLDLTESQHCQIKEVQPAVKKVVIVLQSTKTKECAVCSVEGFWMHTVLTEGDTVHIKAKKLENGEWTINNDQGLLVYEPDILISTTSVVNSLFCKRRSVLSENFRGFEPKNKAMIVGTMVHTLLQTALRDSLCRHEEIEKVAKAFLESLSMVKDLYDSGITVQELQTDMFGFIPKIVDFMVQYVRNFKQKGARSIPKDNWKGWIDSIDDIEENIWCTELGLKGKVDITVKSDKQLMPLELKTGRASVSLEHRGQVMLYIMMMNKLGYRVSSGLLLYLREGVLKEIPMTEREQRDIIILRNELAYYLTRRPKIIKDEATGGKKLYPPELPEPINHFACEKCPYNLLCASYAKYNKEDVSKNKVLNIIQQNDLISGCISEEHLNYIMEWVTMLSIESSTAHNAKHLRDIYTKSPQEREIFGRCVINVKVTKVGVETNGVYEHTFMKATSEEGTNFFANGICENNYVVVSMNTRPAVAAGFVTDISQDSLSVTLDRNLNRKYANQIFHIDNYDSSSTHLFSLANLMLLLEVTPRSQELRNIIIDRKPPTFLSTLPKAIAAKGKGILMKLNVVQQRAVLKSVAAKDYYMIMGMPGTGKTATIVALVQLLRELRKTVLITSHTHSAVDNVCLRLTNLGVKLLRLGSEARMHPDLKKYSEHSLTEKCKTPEDFKEVYDSAQVIAVTCLGSDHPALSKRTMDICIVDESTQVLQCSVIRPLHCAKTFILVGDPKQLPAVIKSTEARCLGMSESLFERLHSKEACTVLNLNYRMNKTITKFANDITYGGELKTGNEDVARATLKLKNNEVVDGWVKEALDTSLEKSVTFLDTGPVWNLKQDVSDCSYVNVYEAAIVATLVRTLLKAGIEDKDIGVIAIYRNQVAHISSLIKTENVSVSTVDQFQGMDKEVIVVSCTKSRDTGKTTEINQFEILEDQRRLTVAITRAKHKLILIGDAATLSEYSTFKKVVSVLKSNTVRLEESEEFDWRHVLENVAT